MARKTKAMRPQDYRTLAGFRHALRQFLAFSEVAAAGEGVTPVQHQALLAIKGMPGNRDVSVGDLAAWLGIRHHSCVGLVDRLVALGLVRRRADPKDGRRMTLRLTARAGGMLARLSVVHRDELRRLSGSLGIALAKLR